MAALLVVLVLSAVGCGPREPAATTNPQVSQEFIAGAKVSSASQQNEASDSFELYSTLAGKMARVEELWNRIDRFLGDAAFQDRLSADAGELHELLTECHSLYPKKLPRQDQTRFDRAIDQTAAAAQELIDSLQAADYPAARVALNQIGIHRQKGHAEFSH